MKSLFISALTLLCVPAAFAGSVILNGTSSGSLPTCGGSVSANFNSGNLNFTLSGLSNPECQKVAGGQMSSKRIEGGFSNFQYDAPVVQGQTIAIMVINDRGAVQDSITWMYPTHPQRPRTESLTLAGSTTSAMGVCGGTIMTQFTGSMLSVYVQGVTNRECEKIQSGQMSDQSLIAGSASFQYPVPLASGQVVAFMIMGRGGREQLESILVSAPVAPAPILVALPGSKGETALLGVSGCQGKVVSRLVKSEHGGYYAVMLYGVKNCTLYGQTDASGTSPAGELSMEQGQQEEHEGRGRTYDALIRIRKPRDGQPAFLKVRSADNMFSNLIQINGI